MASRPPIPDWTDETAFITDDRSPDKDSSGTLKRFTQSPHPDRSPRPLGLVLGLIRPLMFQA
jgi:hypothetical protein